MGLWAAGNWYSPHVVPDVQPDHHVGKLMELLLGSCCAAVPIDVQDPCWWSVGSLVPYHQAFCHVVKTFPLRVCEDWHQDLTVLVPDIGAPGSCSTSTPSQLFDDLKRKILSHKQSLLWSLYMYSTDECALQTKNMIRIGKFSYFKFYYTFLVESIFRI